MTTKLYYEDLYQRAFSATVLEAAQDRECWRIRLEQTAFYPEGGGQPSDIGTLGDAVITQVVEEEGEIWHLADRQLPAGQLVRGVIDWPRRFALMQQHLGQHILSAFADRLFEAPTVSAHIRPGLCHIDVDGALDAAQLLELERHVNDTITRNIPVEILHPTREEAQKHSRRKLPEEGELRIVKIEGVDYTGCCGTHVSRTGEIGAFKIYRHEAYKGGTRIFFAGGNAAMERYREVWKNTVAMGQMMSAALEELPARLESLLADERALRQQNSQLRAQLTQLRAQSMLAQAQQTVDWRLIVQDVGETTPEELRELCQCLSAQEHVAALLGGATPKGAALAFGCAKNSVGISAGELLRECLSYIDGKGGGSAVYAQGMGQNPAGIALALQFAGEGVKRQLAKR